MIFKDYYKILGLQSNKVTSDEIKVAYREMAKKYHPDIVASQDEHSEEIFKDVNEAYKILSNEKTRRRYDFSWNRNVGRKQNKNKSQEKKSFKEILFEVFFGGIVRKNINEEVSPIYGEDVNTEINVSIQEAFFGANKVLKFRNVKGKETSFSVKVPAGVQNGDKLRIVGQGKPGRNGGKNGDLLVFIKIKGDNKLNLAGADLVYELVLETYEAALGCDKEIEVLGEKIKIIIPRGTSSSDRLVIKNKGYKTLHGTRGNLIIVTKIVIPKELSKDQIKLYENLKTVS